MQGKVMRGRRHDWWHLGVIVIESITPRPILCQGDTHTHALTGAPMGHSDTVQIKNETDGCAGGGRKERRYERRRVFGWYIIVVC